MSIADRRVETCRHFTGLNKLHCREGIKYQNTDWEFANPPCIYFDQHDKCEKWESLTPEEVAETQRRVRESIEAMASLRNRETDKCIVCGQPITAMEQVRRCVYAVPCGCRLWQGSIPEAWESTS